MRIAALLPLFSALALVAWTAGCGVTPEPLETGQIDAVTVQQANLAVMDQEPISGPVTLYEAMARALKYNLDYKVEMMQEQLRGGELILASTELLPRVSASAGRSDRDSYSMSGELNLDTGVETEPDKISQDRKVDVADISFSWNVLDFALSYVRARQAANQYLIAQETKRKVIQRTLEDTRTAYWRAYSADRLVKKLRALETRVQGAIQNARALSTSGDMSAVTALTYERELVQIRLLAQKLDSDLSLAKAQLSTLMNVPPGTNFTLSDEGSAVPSPAILALSGKEMVAEAMFNRSELHELEYQKRINQDEVTAALLELLPGLQGFIGDNVSSDSFLLNPNWVGWGVTAAWNLIKVAQLPAKMKSIEAQDNVLDGQSLAMTMVVMTQVYVSRIRYAHFIKELEIARNYNDVQSKLTAHVRAEAAAGRIGEQIVIREEMNALVAKVKHDIALANMHTGAANIFASLGLDLQATEIDQELDVKSLAARLRDLWADRAAVSARGRYLLEIAGKKSAAQRQTVEVERRATQEAMYKSRTDQIRRDQELLDAWRRGGGPPRAEDSKGVAGEGAVRG